MYRSRCSGESLRKSPRLSKPWPSSSAGRSSPTGMSTPTRSRMVLVYSARLSRRIVTRPGLGVAVRSMPLEDAAHRLCEPLHFGRLRPWPFFRRHRVRAQLLEHPHPCFALLQDRRLVAKFVQGEFHFLFLRAMTVGAMLLDERDDHIGHIGRILRECGTRNANNDRQRQHTARAGKDTSPKRKRGAQPTPWFDR